MSFLIQKANGVQAGLPCDIGALSPCLHRLEVDEPNVPPSVPSLEYSFGYHTEPTVCIINKRGPIRIHYGPFVVRFARCRPCLRRVFHAPEVRIYWQASQLSGFSKEQATSSVGTPEATLDAPTGTVTFVMRVAGLDLR